MDKILIVFDDTGDKVSFYVVSYDEDVMRFNGHYINDVNCPDSISEAMCEFFYAGGNLKLEKWEPPFEFAGIVINCGFIA